MATDPASANPDDRKADSDQKQTSADRPGGAKFLEAVGARGYCETTKSGQPRWRWPMIKAAISPISTTMIGIKTITQASNLKEFFIVTCLLEVLAYPVSEATVQ
jgi:hypothetical protein